ncbi:hypothetical protein JCM18899A_54960 [Nocardioides sp. AN3]
MDLTRKIGPARSGHHPNTAGVPLDLDGVRDMYADRLDRLRELKREWDPDNTFSGNHNVLPAELARVKGFTNHVEVQ